MRVYQLTLGALIRNLLLERTLMRYGFAVENALDAFFAQGDTSERGRVGRLGMFEQLLGKA